MIKFKTTSAEMTEHFGEALGRRLAAGDVIALDGDLGAGKTCLTRGLAAGLGAASFVSAPTFTIVNEYEGGRFMMFHFDTYRLEDEDDFINAGLDEYFDRGGVCVIEWSEVIKGILPKGTIHFRITGTGDERFFEAGQDDDGDDDRDSMSERIAEAVREAGIETL